MFDGLASAAIVCGGLLFMRRRLLSYLRFFQQEDYIPSRFLQWISKYRAFDRKGTIIVLASAIAAYMASKLSYGSIAVACVGALALWLVASFEEDPRFAGKVTLKMTERATRIYRLALILYFVASLVWMRLENTNSQAFQWIGMALLFQLAPLWILGSNAFLSSHEKKLQQNYVEEAKKILQNISPYTIGITGSYGKTSTKDALGNILQVALAPTFWPPKSFNSLMGITREIRMKMQKGTRYAVIEMGAYGRGSIARLCALTPPSAGIITGIGTAHLERFGTTDNILNAKAELAKAIPLNGVLVCNGDNDGARKIALDNPKKTTLLYGFEEGRGMLDCSISDWKTTPNGTEFTLKWQGKTYEGFTRLLGKPALSNIMAAFTMACALGCQPDFALAVIHNLPPVDNRLQIDKDGSVTYLRDAYNSNPSGFEAALDVLKEIPGSRRILMTPGIIELGPQQAEENEKAGRKAAKVCDLAVIVGETNRDALVKGLRDGGFDLEKTIVCDNRESAFQKLAALRREGDIILLENDLTDLYETKIRL